MLEVHNITAGYPGNRSAIEDISFEVQAGERVAIIGPNGAGKTTLFKTLIGLIPHRAGYISLYGRDCRTSHTLLGYVPQHEGIDWDFPATVYDVVMMGRTRQIGWLRWPQRVDREMVYRALEQVGMSSFANHRLNELSGGQKRRVFIARSLAQETDLLLLDEPFSGVDVAAEDEILVVLDRLSTQGIGILLATHNLDVAAARFDRLLLLKGQVIAFGSPADVFRPDLLKAAYGDRVAIFERNGTSIILADQH